MCRKSIYLFLIVLALSVTSGPLVAGVLYGNPPGGWTYTFQGDAAASAVTAALDGKWDHYDTGSGGSDAWDGLGIGAGVGAPGGVSALLDGTTSFLRMQDCGDPRDHGFADPTNRKIYFAHNITTDGAPSDILDSGVTLTFRARIATGAPLDPMYPDTAGGSELNTTPGGTAWPAGGNGYVSHDGGKDSFGIRALNDKMICFALSLATDDDQLAARGSGLTMNNLNGSIVTDAVDIWENDPGTIKMLPISDLKAWHEFFINIKADTSGGGTHLVKIWMDGSMTPTEFHVTASNANDGNYDTFGFLSLGVGATPQMGAIDVDFFSYKPGLYAPRVEKKASQPIPADKARTPPSGPSGTGYFMLLEFTAGHTATSHTAYFSSNFDDVNDRNPAVSLGSPPYPEVYPTGYYVGFDAPGIPAFAHVPLQRGTIYYWAVDESNGVGTYPGDVWSFTIPVQQAWDPSPPNGDQLVNADPDVALSWKLGDVDATSKDVSYDVYYGTVFADVNTSTTPTVHVTATSAVTGSLLANTVYYWRVDTRLTETTPPPPFDFTITKGDVWSFKTLPVVDITDPDLVGWWKLDGDIVPAIAFDSSGYGNHGAIVGGAQRAPGQIDEAIELNGSSQYVTVPNSTSLNLTKDFTIGAWIHPDVISGSHGIVTKVEGSSNKQYTLTFADGELRFEYELSGNGYAMSGGTVTAGEWQHVAVTIDSLLLVNLYINGVSVASETAPGEVVAQSNPVVIGRWSGTYSSYYFDGLIDDVRLYDYALPASQIKVLAGRLGATGPNPADESSDVERTPVLSWEAGAYAASVSGHKVYFSADRDAVMNRTVTAITRTDPCYPVATILDLGKTYYWAVDEVNNLHLDKVWPGDLWSFTTINNKVVDSFETYEDEQTVPAPLDVNWIYFVYTDGFGDLACTAGTGNGSGAKIALQRPGQGGSSLAMTFLYDNDGLVKTPSACNPLEPEVQRAYYSKAEALVAKLPSGIGSDWTADGVKSLSLWFYGDPSNSIEPMWVQLTDASNNKAKVFYGTYSDEDINDMNEASWDGHEWMIDLEDFNVPPTPVNVKNVKSIAIGIGNETGSAGSSGTLYFDDIRLYTSRCVLTRRSADFAALDYAPEASSGDCVINARELEVMTRDWLLTDTLIPAEPLPGSSNLMLHYKFEMNMLDSSTNGLHGTAGGFPTYELRTAGNNAIVLAGSDYVNCGNPPQLDFGTGDWTVAAWIKPIATTDQRMIYCKGGDAAGGIRYMLTLAETNDYRMTVTTDDNVDKYQRHGDIRVDDGEWHHVLGMRDGTALRVYVDGIDDGATTIPAGYDLSGTSQANAFIGANWNYETSVVQKFFIGAIDEVRIYNTALSQGQILNLMGLAQLHIPVPSPAEIYEGEAEGSRVINFRDYAVLTDRWLEEDFFP